MNARFRRMTHTALMDGLAFLLALIVLFPVLYGFFGAFKEASEFAAWPPSVLPRHFTYFENFKTVFARVPMLRYYANSLIVATVSASVRLVFSLFAAYAFAFFRFPGRRFVFFMMLGTMMLPPDTLVITNYLTVTRLGLVDTYLGICIVSFVGASQMFMLRQHLMTSPRAIREAAALDGCGDLRFIVHILVPMARPLVITLFLQSFLTQWNSYLWPLLTTNRDDMRTVQIGVTMLTKAEATNYETILAGVTMVVLPTVLLFAVLHRYVRRAMNDGPLLS